MVANLARYVLLCSLFSIWQGQSSADAQVAPANVQEALRLVDSASPADIAAAISKLEAIVSDQNTLPPPPAAWTALAMCQLRQSDYDNAAKSLQRSATANTSNTSGRRGTNLRIALLVALAREDAAAAEVAFKDLVRSIASGQGDPIDHRLTATALGTCVGMLGTERAKSPISARVLKIGHEQLLISKLRGVAVHYQAALDSSTERTEALVANFLRIEKEGIDAVAADLAQREEQLKQKSSQFQEQKELTGEVIRNTREQVDQNMQDLRQLAADLNRIQLKLRQPTPGHPGPKRQPPAPLPSAFSIPVDEYETQTDYQYITQNGQQVRVPVTRQVRRPQSEIDNDRNRIYDRMRREHERDLSEYRAYDSQYNSLLTSWANEDQRRRTELNKEKADLEVKRNELVAANKAISEDKKDSTKDLRAKRTAKEQEEFEVELLKIAVDTYREGQPQRAFRPQHFESLNWTQEKLILQKP